MDVLEYLELGVEALPAAEKVFEDAETLVEKIEGEVKPEAQKLFDDAKSAFESLKSSGVAGTNVGGYASEFASDLTDMWANWKQVVQGDVSKLSQIVAAGESQLKLLTAQLAGGNDVTKT